MGETSNRPRKPADSEKVLNRLASLCSRSEQCSYDIREKLRRAELTQEDAERILRQLTELGFVDDRRYARSYATDKVRFSAWGRNKIRLHLAAKRIDRALIAEAMEAIDPADYKDALLRATRAKCRTLDMNIPEDRAKLLRHLASRGFEPALAMKVLEAIKKRIGE